MRIDSSIPLHVARAYGLMPAARSAPLKAAAPVEQPKAAAPAEASRPPDGVQKLIAGHVPGAVDFASASTPTSPAGAYQLYTRAADKIEAAVAVQIGRAVDIKG